MAGRPPKFTDAVVKKLEEVFALDGSVEEACFYAGISTVTYYEHIKQKPELANRFEALRLNPVLKARTTVVKKLSESYQNSMDYLARKRKKEFAPRQEVTGADGQPIFDDATKQKSKSVIARILGGNS